MSGLSLRISSYPSPQLRMTRALKFSNTTSEIEMRRRTNSRPRAVRAFRVMPSLLGLVSLKLPEELRVTSIPSGVNPLRRPRSVSGHSTLITWAPSAPSHLVPHGPALTQPKSSTRIPSKARGA